MGNKIGLFILLMGLFINYLLFYAYPNTLPSSTQSSNIVRNPGEVLGRTYPLSEPDINAREGGTITIDGVTAIVGEDTFTDDVYMRVDRTARTNPIQVEGLWQVSDIYDTKIRYMTNDNDVTSYEANKNYSLSFTYDPKYLQTDQGVVFSDDTITLARGETATGPWTVLSNVAHDGTNDTVAIVTNRGGFYMVVGGFHKVSKIEAENIGGTSLVGDVGEKNEDGATTVVLEENEIVVTITPIMQEAKEEDISSEEGLLTEANSQEHSNIYESLLEVIRTIFGG